MIPYAGGPMHEASPSAWATLHCDGNPVAVDDRCVNEGAKRDDGTFCKERAEASGWCRACSAELFPEGWETQRS